MIFTLLKQQPIQRELPVSWRSFFSDNPSIFIRSVVLRLIPLFIKKDTCLSTTWATMKRLKAAACYLFVRQPDAVHCSIQAWQWHRGGLTGHRRAERVDTVHQLPVCDTGQHLLATALLHQRLLRLLLLATHHSCGHLHRYRPTPRGRPVHHF